MNWTLINIVGDIVIFLLSVIGAGAVAFFALIVASMISDRRREQRDIQRQEPITQVRVTVPTRQEIPDAFYRAFEE